MDTILIESSKCPICVEILSAAVYQCKNGHIFCANCSARLATCPTCRVELHSPGIRNRLAETIFDGVKFDCEFKKRGCTEKLSRTEILEHSRKCPFRETGFNLCQLLGYSCDYLSSNRRMFGVCKHFRNIHQAQSFENWNLTLLVEVKPVLSTKPKIIWKPILFIDIEENFDVRFVLVHIGICQKEKAVKFSCVEVAYNDGFPDEEDINSHTNRKVDFVIKSEKPSELPHVAWSSKIYTLKHSTFAVKQLSHRIPYQAFLKYSKNGFVTVECSLEKDDKQPNNPPTYCTLNLLNS